MNRVSIGIDIGGTKMLIKHEIDTLETCKRYSTGKNISFDEIFDNYNNYIESNDLEVISLAVAIPGLVEGDIVTACDVVPGLDGIKTSDFSDNYPVKFLNDVEAALIEERNNYPDVKNLTVIMIGTGIGMSMLIDGRKCHGASGFTGELGYTVVNTDNGPTFLDNVAAGAGILGIYGGSSTDLKNDLDNSVISAQQIIDKAAEYMAIGLTNIISLINPELIIIGGGTSTYNGYFDKVLESTKKYSLPVLLKATKIITATNIGKTVLNGAYMAAKIQ